MIHNLGVVASNGHVHQAVLEAIRTVLSPQELGALA
jgi:hypothetical protein